MFYPNTQERDQGAGWTQIRVVISATMLLTESSRPPSPEVTEQQVKV